MIGQMFYYLILTEDKNKQNIRENNRESLYLLLAINKNCNLAKNYDELCVEFLAFIHPIGQKKIWSG
jgi:hypothetical protein